MMNQKIKKYLCVVCALLLLCTSLAGCAAKAGGTGKIRIVTTIFPQYDFAKAITGNTAEIEMLLPPGADSHSYEPSVSDILKVKNCDLFIMIGGTSEYWADDMLSSITGVTVLKLMDITDAMEEVLVEGMQAEEEDTADGAVEYDEHIWTSLRNCETFVSAICDALSAVSPENAALYTENASAYISELKALDTQISDIVSASARKTLVFADRFPFAYFARDYGLSYYAAFPGCSGDCETSPKTLAFLINKVNEENIPYVFTIEYSNGSIADVICESTKAGRLTLHSCHNLSADDVKAGATFLGLWAKNIENLRKALS